MPSDNIKAALLSGSSILSVKPVRENLNYEYRAPLIFHLKTYRPLLSISVRSRTALMH